MLEIKNLHVSCDGKEIIKGVSLSFAKGEVHALMGPNGSGKSTISHAIMGNPKYKVTSGQIILNGENITGLKADERARKGLFLSFQHPPTITGVTISAFLREAVNNLREEKLGVVEFHKLLKENMAKLKMDKSFLKRYLNDGFSGGEKKRAEMLQLMMLKPQFAFLDETDSGLDVDAIKIVANGIKEVQKKSDMGIILITHYNRFLEFFDFNKVSVIVKGKIVAQGGKELASRIESEGFGGFENGE
jgi:Fe-S cluster assembly ATP-binding protein